jgi:chromosome segregation ATPase
MAATPQESSFGRGAIVRVKLFQFLTYEAVEFRPGPRLNVVMGPNGTGKSSIVMAIAVGLGAAPRQLGRADMLSEFILTGRDVAVTELELLDDEATGRTRTIERRITRSQRGTSKWKIDGKSATEPQVKELVEKDLKIQIGNLCTFLPQEKVGEFSAFDDIGLLKETEKALGGQDLVDKHEALIRAEKEA